MSATLEDRIHSIAASVAEMEQALGPNQQELHMVIVPYPLQGTINPMMQLAKALIAMYPMKVSFVNIKLNHERIQKGRLRSSASPCASPVFTSHDIMKASREHAPSEGKIEFLWVDNGLPDDFDYTDDKRLGEFHMATLNMKEPLRELLKSLNQKNPPISCVIFGSFCHWIHSISTELGIPSVFFWAQSISVLSIYYHSSLLAANGFFPYKKLAASDSDGEPGLSPETSKLVSYIPGVPPLHPSNIPTLLHVDDTSDSFYITLEEQFSILQRCQGIIVNSFEELERDAYQAMRGELPFPVSMVGPLVPSAFQDEGDVNDNSVGASLYEEKMKCLEWLEHQRKGSVLYVAFGSIFHLSAEDIVCIANGIKDSKQPFLWAIRPRPSVEDVADILPEGFLDDTKELGLMVPWAPQTQVLAHPAVGAFLTHCGWNSTLESVCMGVPMIACPFMSDQPTNSTYVCEFWKVGMALKRHADGSLRSVDVERAVRSVLQGKDGEEMRRKANLLREAARRATRAQGSSRMHMEEFVQTMMSRNKGQKGS